MWGGSPTPSVDIKKGGGIIILKINAMKSLKLSCLEAQKLNEKEMGMLNGGTSIVVTQRTCTCSCYHVDNGGSSVEENMNANYKIGNGGHSKEGDNENVATTITIVVNP